MVFWKSNLVSRNERFKVYWNFENYGISCSNNLNLDFTFLFLRHFDNFNKWGFHIYDLNMLIIWLNPIIISEVEVILITRLHLNNGCKN